MSMPEGYAEEKHRPIILTDEQQRETELRMLHDARLVQGGARVDSHGLLVLAGVQIENVYASGDPFLSADEQAEREARSAWLDTSVAEAIDTIDDADINSRLKGRVKAAVSKVGLQTWRHVLAYGKQALNETDNVGKSIIRVLDDYIANGPFDYSWKERTSLSDILSICETLDQVPAMVVHRNEAHKKPTLRVPYKHMSVRQILGLPPATRIKLVLREYEYNDRDVIYYSREVYKATKDFAKVFTETQLKLDDL